MDEISMLNPAKPDPVRRAGIQFTRSSSRAALPSRKQSRLCTILRRIGEGKYLPAGEIQPRFEQRPPGCTLRGEIVALVPKQVMTISPLLVQILDWNMTDWSAMTRACLIAKALTMAS